MGRLNNYLHAFFSDKHGKLTVGQLPNLPLIIWLVFAILAHLLSRGDVHATAQIISKAAIIIWAMLEIYSGDSPFRRVLGTVVLVLSIASLL